MRARAWLRSSRHASRFHGRRPLVLPCRCREPEPGTTAAFVTFIAAERERLGKLAKKANMQADR